MVICNKFSDCSKAEHFSVPVCGLLCLGLLLMACCQLLMFFFLLNMKFYFQDQQKKDHEVTLLNVGSCGLHTLHNAFGAGHAASGWRLGDWMRALHQLYKDSPARRQDFETYTGATEFPSLFCSHRYLFFLSR